ncbi:MAG: proline dehydrogenase family protein [Acidobacteriota bacterium]|nr:proline dehydrogenase family protein [Acidobacteriota bacterium]
MNDFRLNLNDTAVAFAGKTDAELERKYWMFRMMSSQLLTDIGTKSAEFGLSLGLPIKFLIKETVFRQFCGGETIQECERAIRGLARSNIGTVLDYSIEGKKEERVFEQTKAEILRTVKRAAGDANLPFSVFKVTGIARFEILERISAGRELANTERVQWNSARNRVQEICEYAASVNQPIFIDAEESWIQDAIDDLVREMMQLFNREKPIVFNTLQMYRHDRLEFLKKSHAEARQNNYRLAVKFVRGAYMEKERERAAELGYQSPIQPDKASTDRDYDAAIEYCMENIDEIAFVNATHNEESVQNLVRLMKEKNLPNNDPRIHFSQLYGMSDNLSYVLAKEGYNVSKYVPYGPVKDALPYLIRRARENTAVAGQMSRELEMIDQEIKRRKIARQQPALARKSENENVLPEMRK